MLAPAKTFKTVDDYVALPEGAPYQLVDGELIISPAPSFFHQRVIWRLGPAFVRFVEETNAGVVVGSPVDVFLSEHDAYQPDILFVAKDRQGIIEENGVHGAPDLVVEVLSPSTGYYDLTHKKRVYAEHGVKEYWIVDPIEKTVEVFENVEGTYISFAQARNEGTVPSCLLEGFEVTLADLFVA